ncbi:unnamed protein product [Musa acuminata subsp. burmannicoides]
MRRMREDRESREDGWRQEEESAFQGLRRAVLSRKSPLFILIVFLVLPSLLSSRSCLVVSERACISIGCNHGLWKGEFILRQAQDSSILLPTDGNAFEHGNFLSC